MAYSTGAAWCFALCAVVLGCPTEARGERPPNRTLTNDQVGYSLSYPRGWTVARRVVATEFAEGASCQSVRIVDFAPPENTGPSAEIRHSFVQICWKRSAGSSLDDFMRKTYRGRLADAFERTRFGGVPAYRANEGRSTTYFLQTERHRMHIVAAVVAEPSRRAQRSEQVRRILSSFSLGR